MTAPGFYAQEAVLQTDNLRARLVHELFEFTNEFVSSRLSQDELMTELWTPRSILCRVCSVVGHVAFLLEMPRPEVPTLFLTPEFRQQYISPKDNSTHTYREALAEILGCYVAAVFIMFKSHEALVLLQSDRLYWQLAEIVFPS